MTFAVALAVMIGSSGCNSTVSEEDATYLAWGADPGLKRLGKEVRKVKPAVTWELLPPKQGRAVPLYWPEGRGIEIRLQRRGFESGDVKNGTGGIVHVWIMGSDYETSKPPSYETQVNPATEIEPWRSQRVFIWGAVGQEWRDWKQDVAAALKATDIPPGQLPGSGTSLEQAIEGGFWFAAVCVGTSEAGLASRELGVSHASQEFRVLTILAGEGPAGQVVKFGYICLYPGRERPIEKGERVIWVARKAGYGSQRQPNARPYGIKALPDTPENRKAVIEAVKTERPAD